MIALAFLGVALAVSLIGWLIILYRNRVPRDDAASVDEFARRMAALAPDDDPDHPRDRGPEADR